MIACTRRYWTLRGWRDNNENQRYVGSWGCPAPIEIHAATRQPSAKRGRTAPRVGLHTMSRRRLRGGVIGSGRPKPVPGFLPRGGRCGIGRRGVFDFNGRGGK